MLIGHYKIQKIMVGRQKMQLGRKLIVNRGAAPLPEGVPPPYYCHGIDTITQNNPYHEKNYTS
jgi:hypothetical protein